VEAPVSKKSKNQSEPEKETEKPIPMSGFGYVVRQRSGNRMSITLICPLCGKEASRYEMDIPSFKIKKGARCSKCKRRFSAVIYGAN
jgi:hypothetical protein